MKFKIDENLPVEIAELLRSAHYNAATVVEQGLRGADDSHIADVCLREGRILVTLDLDFADIRVYPPRRFPGFMVFRAHRQDKHYLVDIFSRVIPLIERETIKGQLWIIEESRVRIRE